MLAQRRRRCANINPALGQSGVFVGMAVIWKTSVCVCEQVKLTRLIGSVP